MKKSVVRIFTLIMVVAMLSSCVFALCACNDKGDDNASVFAQNTRFAVDYQNVRVMDIKVTSVLEATVKNLVIDDENTYFEFRNDGTMHMQIQTHPYSYFSKLLEEVDLSSFDIKTSVDRYVEPMFPGFTQKLKDYDLKGALGLIKHSLGFNIEGLDFENPDIKEAVKYVGDEMALPANILTIIPSDTVLRLTLDTQYALRNLKASDGTNFRAIYLGYKVKDNPQTAPFGVFTLTENDTKAALSIEFMNIHIAIKQR